MHCQQFLILNSLIVTFDLASRFSHPNAAGFTLQSEIPENSSSIYFLL